MPPDSATWLQVTTSAVKKIHNLIADESDPYIGLRIYITGGGCSGFQYGFGFVERANQDDVTIPADCHLNNNESLHISLYIDTMSFSYLKGSTVDYREDVSGARFVIQNPHAKTTCGCGSSFSV